ncbi:MAG: hypothetical protein IPN70_03485 [Candidatus Moraniibacteriota bacterium]|nr:MAG: hypothetical protein IPN70_03485 [Candidatus Moranbacteria bacterium]
MAVTPYNLEPIEDDLKIKNESVLEKKENEEEKEILPAAETLVESENPSLKEASFEKFLEKTKMQISDQMNASEQVHAKENAHVDELLETDIATRITKLIAVAEEQGITQAFEIALKFDDLYTIDTLHDTLSGSLYEELKKKGLIHEE